MLKWDFCSYDLDPDPMTLIQELDLVILKMYLHIKVKILGQSSQKLEHEQDRQTDTQTDATKHITR